ncbi:MAG: DUF4142 domain-containing protein [Alphaproteobacteria bacterium]|nr:DUF4142 domain-containing protein [Alphaproteobacteria bacterium]
MRQKFAFVIVLSAIAASPAMAAGGDGPKDFVGDAIKGDNSEIALGQMAQRSGGTAAMRDFGRTLVADHTKAKQQVADVAHGLGADVPDDVMPEAKSEQAKLQSMSGADFDREFASYMVDDHKKDIDKFAKEAGMHRGPTSDLAAKQLPTLRKHLSIAQGLMKSGK